MKNIDGIWEFFRKDDIFFINGTIWRRAMEIKKKKDNGVFRKIIRFFRR